eukprot:2263783-Amphidinium_carterae.1
MAQGLEPLKPLRCNKSPKLKIKHPLSLGHIRVCSTLCGAMADPNLSRSVVPRMTANLTSQRFMDYRLHAIKV